MTEEELTGASREAFAEPKRDYHEDWDYWGNSGAMEWGDSEGNNLLRRGRNNWIFFF